MPPGIGEALNNQLAHQYRRHPERSEAESKNPEKLPESFRRGISRLRLG
jgi:hypothetical protein